jgi:hypothetical protein
VAIRSALISVDGFGDLDIFLTSDRRGCAGLAKTAGAGPHVWVWVHSDGANLPLGRALTTTGKIRFVVNFVSSGGSMPISVSRGAKLVFTRMDSAAGGVWRGRLTVPATALGGSRFAFSGTFGARWCGQR